MEAQEVDIYATKVEKEESLIKADNDVLVFSNSYFISANKATYDENTRDLELFGDVNILRGEKDRSNSCYAKLNLDTNKAEFKNFFFANSDMEVWFKSEESGLDDKTFSGKNSIVSSCNVENPDWEIRFSEGEFDREDNFVHLHHAKFYIKNVPVFYTPYIGFSADTSRRTGLLIPIFEINQDDGFYYEQPIYFAFANNWDMQVNPQLRTSRGVGAYASFRFMDSEFSSGEFNTGVFLENDAYYHKENLKNKSHRGLELKYHRDNLFVNLLDLGSNVQEGLWLDAIYLNDVDYLNLGRRDYRDLTSLATSKFSYFLADENNYYAAYANYYIDTAAVSNSATLQEYPSFQYHRFLNGLFNNTIQYSFDANFNRYYRDVGVHATLFNFNLPLTYHQSFFDDFLHFQFTESLYASFVEYTDNTNGKDNEQLLRNNHNFALYTELSKAYDNFYHTVYFGADYFLVGAKTGDISQEFVKSPEDTSSFNLSALQYFYNEAGDKKLKHRLNLSYNTDTFSLDNVNNLIQYYFDDDISISNEAQYSHELGRFTKSLTYVDIYANYFSFTLSHAYKYGAGYSSSTNTSNSYIAQYSFIGANASYDLNANYKLLSGIWFDTNRSGVNYWELGYVFQRKCWNYSLTYRERVDPQLTSGGIKANKKNGIYFTFNLYPIGGVSYDFALQENESMVNSI